MIAVRELSPAQLESTLGRTSPVVKLGIALAWLIGLAFTLEVLPPLVMGGMALAAGISIGRIPGERLGRTLAPLWLAAVGIGLFNMLFSAVNQDPAATELVRLGPFRVTEEAAAAGLGLGLRVVAIAAVGAVFALTTDATRLVDSLVQQAKVPERFAYGALAAYQAIPRFAEDLATLRQARRIRGLRGTWHPRLLLGLLVLAIRHGDRMALAMDARAFGSGPRTSYRDVGWTARDGIITLAAFAVLWVALALGR